MYQQQLMSVFLASSVAIFAACWLCDWTVAVSAAATPSPSAQQPERRGSHRYFHRHITVV